jgi:DNA-directed RNA polymerase II subunit RPB2
MSSVTVENFAENSSNNVADNVADNDKKSDPLTKYIEEPWNVIHSYFEGKHLKQLVRHQIESYNDFVSYQIQKTVQMFNPVRICSEQDFVKEVNKNRLEMFVTFENFSIYRPQIHENNGASKLMFPQEARYRNFTYASNMTLDMNIKYVIRSGPVLETEQVLYKSFPKINIGKLPIMLKSSICVLEQYKHIHHTVNDECYMDPGGYFIINGSEKTCLGQERIAENLVHCFNISKNNSKWQWMAEIRSVPDFKCISPKQISLLMSAKNNGMGYAMSLQIPRIKNPIPLFIVFRAIGIITDKDICRHIVLDIDDDKNKNMMLALRASIVEANQCLDQESAIKYIISQAIFTPHNNMDKEMGAKKKHNFTMDVLNNDLFPHCKTTEQRIYFLGYMTHQLLLASFGIQESDDRDSYLNKRIELTGTLLNNLFRNYFNKLVKDMQKQVIKEINNGSWRSVEDYTNIINLTNVYKIVKSTTIENGLKRALSTGDFCIKHTNNNNKVGVAQVLNRLTYISSLSHLRRINTPIDKSGKLVPPRKLHNTTWGFLCPVETPEGGSVGVVKNISYMTHITIPCNSNALYDFVKPYIIELDKQEMSDLANGVKVFINGTWLGMVKEPVELYTSLKEKKYKGIINIYTSILFNIKKREIRVCSDAGRLTRPVLRVKDNKLIINNSHIRRLVSKELTWEDLLINNKIDESIIEYIDPAEQNLSMIAMEPSDLNNNKNGLKYTHCEIHPSTIFGIVASCTPFPEHNQSPRNTYQCAMAKQAIGMYVTNFDSRMDKTAYVLSYPMRPLVETRLMNLIKLNEIPSGSQVVVAIMTHTGYNQEDSVLMNKGSIDRGLFQATIFHTEKDEEKKIHGDEEIRCRPDPSKTKGIKFGNYDKVNSQGVIPENTLVENRDIIISKVLPIKEARNDHTKVIKYEDHSHIYRTREESYIDKNYLERNGEGYNFCKVRIRTVRKPVIGDKFSSRHGQKGTVGNIIPEENMPFTAEGIRPDIIINPHAIPSRMTIAQLKETLLGKVLIQMGLFGDGTSFGKFDIKDIASELQKLGYESKGNELMYNGLTGEQIESSVFIGPVFYQRLKHMVSDKMHSRSIGPMVNLTRQPAEGRSRDGGLRYGEMERDCICSHGASRFNKGRLYDASDAFSVNICKCCGMIAVYNDVTHIHQCKTCNNRTDFDYVELPYSCKLMFQELITMNIAPRIITK